MTRSSASPKVSVVMPIYNRECYLAGSIDSVFAQTLQNFELLLIDDGSSDRSMEIAERYSDPRIRIIRHEQNRGVAAARNTGVAQACGEYIAFLDSDDIALPERIERQAAYLDLNPDCAVVGAWIEWIRADGSQTGKIKRRMTSSQDVAAQRLFRAGIENKTSMARRHVLRQYRFNETFAIQEDLDLWIRVSFDHKIANLPRVLVHAREHEQRTSRMLDDRKKQLRQSIYASQLSALGVEFSESDLERHYMLRRMHKEGYMPDKDYLEWADAWLRSLRSKNKSLGFSPEPAFSRVVSGFWLKTCWHGTGKMGWQSWRIFFSSPLCLAAGSSLGSELLLHAPSWQLIFWPCVAFIFL